MVKGDTILIGSEWLYDKGETLIAPHSEGHELLMEAIEMLREDQRDLIEAIFWERLSYSELAHRLGLGAKQSAHDRTQTAIRALRRNLRKLGFDLAEEMETTYYMDDDDEES